MNGLDVVEVKEVSGITEAARDEFRCRMKSSNCFCVFLVMRMIDVAETLLKSKLCRRAKPIGILRSPSSRMIS
jgi:hypothetical protein